jgi:hypothetical protein
MTHFVHSSINVSSLMLPNDCAVTKLLATRAQRLDESKFSAKIATYGTIALLHHYQFEKFMAKFICNYCHHEMATADENIGKGAKCPKCSQRGVVTPTPPSTTSEQDESDEIEPTTDSVGDVSPNSSRKYRKRNHIGLKYEDLLLPKWAARLIGLAYILLGLLTLGGVIDFIITFNAQPSSPIQAAVGAKFANLFIAGYIVTRSFEKFVRSIARR